MTQYFVRYYIAVTGAFILSVTFKSENEIRRDDAGNLYFYKYLDDDDGDYRAFKLILYETFEEARQVALERMREKLAQHDSESKRRRLLIERDIIALEKQENYREDEK